MFHIVCAVVSHHRSKWHRRPAAGNWTSQCTVCGTQMERVGPGMWLPVADLPDGARRTRPRSDPQAPAAIE